MKRFATALLLAVAGVAPVARAQSTDVALGIEALARRDIQGAEAAFTRGTTSPNPAIQATAWQWRGHLAWKVRGDTTAAAEYLARALSVARDSSTVLLEMARLDGERRRYSDAVKHAFEAFSLQLDAERRGLAARTLVALALEGALAAPPARIRDSIDTRLLSVVRDTLRARVARFPGRTTDAQALIVASLATGADSSFWAGAFSYAHFNAGSPSRHMSQVESSLVYLGLFDPLELAARLRLPPSGGVRLIHDAREYGHFLREMRTAATQYYRQALTGTARTGDLDRAFIAGGRPLWKALRLDSIPYSPAALRRDIRKRFGAVLSIEGSGPAELFLAHVFDETTARTGRRAARVLLLDGVVAYGVDGWLLDGAGGRAGWVVGDTIFALRTAFTETPFRAWLGLTDPQTIPGELVRIGRDSVTDIERAARDSLGYLPGVAARLFRQGIQGILDAPRPPDPSGRPEEVKHQAWFTDQVYNSLLETSIFAHEGRHISDLRANRPVNDADAEFRAKVDEVRMARHPRLAMTAILTPRIGDASSHGQANRRLMIGLNRWIRAHGSEIAGYDVTAPALLQLPLLKDAQLRAAFESMRRP